MHPGFAVVIKPSASALASMGDFVRQMHESSGLLTELEHGFWASRDEVAAALAGASDAAFLAPPPFAIAHSLLRVMAENNGKAQRVFARLAREFPAERVPCPVGSHHALDGAILTHPDVRDPALVARLQTVAGRVLRPRQAG